MPRRLGQHFLSDPRILDRIVDLLDPQPNDIVVEIGPGPGTLTKRLAPRVERVVAIEKDEILVEALRRMDIERVRLVHADALDTDWASFVDTRQSFKIIGNIPYNISTPLINQALGYQAVPCIVFTVQREVADRICANAGTKEYGALSVGVQTYASVERAFRVAAGSFQPPPMVESAAVRLLPRDAPAVPFAQRDAFRRFVVALFGQRRKQIVRVLRNTMNLEPNAAMQAVAACGVAPEARPETLPPESLAVLFETLLR